MTEPWLEEVRVDSSHQEDLVRLMDKVKFVGSNCIGSFYFFF